MDTISVLVTQTKSAYEWFNKLALSVPKDEWEYSPNVMETNIAWQVGHQIISYYYHSILSITGHQPDVFEQVPIRKYADWYTFKSTASQTNDKDTVGNLEKNLLFMQAKSLEIIQNLSPDDLDKPLEPLDQPHPVAKTKFEAIDWNIKHTLWHCGQIAMLKRVMNNPYSFGLN